MVVDHAECGAKRHRFRCEVAAYQKHLIKPQDIVINSQLNFKTSTENVAPHITMEVSRLHRVGLQN